MAGIFEPFKINQLTVKNRFVRSATVDNLGKDQKVSPAELELYRALAKGGVGLIISSGFFPSLDGWPAPGQGRRRAGIEVLFLRAAWLTQVHVGVDQAG